MSARSADQALSAAAPGLPTFPVAQPRSAAPRRSGRSRLAAPVLATGIAALLCGLWAGLERLGLPFPDGQLGLAELHGVLMPLGFLGTLISAERAVALGKGWSWLAPACSGVGSLWLVAGLDSGVGRGMVALGGFVLIAVFVRLHQIQSSWHNTVMGAGAACWAVGGALWARGWDLGGLVPWLAGFLVLTIAGERLELSRLLAPTRRGRTLFLGASLLFLGGLTVSLWVQDVGVRIAGLGLISISAWLATHDIVRRTIRIPGVTRYMAIALSAGYVWLATGGVLWLVIGHLDDGPGYDAMLHAVFLGFVMSMVMAHAPVIVPAVLRVRVPYSRYVYAPLILLHASVLLRLIGGDAMNNIDAWQIGGEFNEIAILAFLATFATLALRAGHQDKARRLAKPARG